MKIRPGTLNDIPAIFKAYVESWWSTYRGLAPEVFVNGMTEAGATAIFHESLALNEYKYFLHVAAFPISLETALKMKEKRSGSTPNNILNTNIQANAE